MGAIYMTEVTNVGPEVEELLEEAGTLVLFEEGAPPELAEMSVLHLRSESREDPPEVGDMMVIDGREFRITAVGDSAWKNMLKLGHASFKFNGAEEVELPGEICLEEPGSGDIGESIRPGVRLEIRSSD
ncbi:MAG TPA: PTS glucitol/sorbitol transporter subunit IIA [Rubrobacter sp.]|nr:PTS glucitol/sorbitol transporter subunit IIA [Rubrobacter sp.]